MHYQISVFNEQRPRQCAEQQGINNLVALSKTNTTNNLESCVITNYNSYGFRGLKIKLQENELQKDVSD